MYLKPFGRIKCLCFVLGLAVVTVGFPLAVKPAAASVVEPKTAWTARPLNPEQGLDDIPVQYCVLRVDFKNGDNLVIARDLSGAMSGAYQSQSGKIIADKDGLLEITIDGGAFRRFHAKPVQNNTLIFQISHDYDLVDHLMAGQAMTLQHNGAALSYGLKGSADGFRALNDCLQELNGGRALVWETGTPSRGPRLQKAPEPKNAFNDPDRNYIIVHEPQSRPNMPKVEAAAVPTVDQAPLASVASETEMEPDSSALDSQETPAARSLRQLISSDIRPRLKQVAGFDLDVTGQAGLAPLTWSRNNVKAHFNLAPIPEGQQAPDISAPILSDLKAACSGEFNQEGPEQYDTAGVSIEEYKLSCVSEHHTHRASINFLSDGAEILILSFEGAGEDETHIFDQRATILGGLSGNL